MKHIDKLTAPVVIAAFGLLTLGGGLSAAASHLITGKDIKNHSIGYVDLSKSAVKKLHGANGARGPKGPSGAAGTHWYGGHVAVLNTLQDTIAYGTAIGFSQAESSTGHFVDILGPTTATTLTSMHVDLTNAPGIGSMREFALVINGTPTTVSCTVQSADTSCGVTLDAPIPANATLYIQSAVSEGEASGAEAAFSWTTKG